MKKLKVTDGKFATLIKDEEAVITFGEDRIPRLYLEERDVIKRVPAGISLTPEHDGQPVMATVRQCNAYPLLFRGKDDIYEEELVDDESIVPISNFEELEELATEKRLQMLSQYSKYLVNMLACIAGIAACVYLRVHESPLYSVTLPGIAAFALGGLLFGLLPFIRIFSAIACKVIVDGYGNTVNLQTGESNLNGGCDLKPF